MKNISLVVAAFCFPEHMLLFLNPSGCHEAEARFEPATSLACFFVSLPSLCSQHAVIEVLACAYSEKPAQVLGHSALAGVQRTETCWERFISWHHVRPVNIPESQHQCELRS